MFRDACLCVLTRAHVDEGVVHQDQLVEVELVGEAFPLGLMEDPLVVVIPGESQGETVRHRGRDHHRHTEGETITDTQRERQ